MGVRHPQSPVEAADLAEAEIVRALQDFSQHKNRKKPPNNHTLGAQSGVNSPPAPCLDLTLINSAISLGNTAVSSPVERAPDMFDLLLEGSSLVSEFSNLIQKNPDLASKCFGEIVDISTLGDQQQSGGTC